MRVRNGAGRVRGGAGRGEGKSEGKGEGRDGRADGFASCPAGGAACNGTPRSRSMYRARHLRV